MNYKYNIVVIKINNLSGETFQEFLRTFGSKYIYINTDQQMCKVYHSST